MGSKGRSSDQEPFIQLHFQDYDPSSIRSTISLGNNKKVLKKKQSTKKTASIKIVKLPEQENLKATVPLQDNEPNSTAVLIKKVDSTKNDALSKGDEPVLNLKQNAGKPNSSSENTPTAEKKKNVACVRCRKRHMNCQKEGVGAANENVAAQCLNCAKAGAVCEYVQPSKKLNVSLQYLQTLQNEISQLKKENVKLKNTLKSKNSKAKLNDLGNSDDYNERTFINYSINQMDPKQQPSLMKNDSENYDIDVAENVDNDFSKNVGGGLVGSKTGQKYFVGSSSMTLFGMEIHSLVEKTKLLIAEKLKTQTKTAASGAAKNIIMEKEQLDTVVIPNNFSSDDTQFSWSTNNVDKILEEEGNAYKIILSSSDANETDSNSFNFSLPSYSYARLLIDTFITYNDGCFYFFNEGLEKANLKKIYNGEVVHEDQILQTIWFCKIMLIFAIGEMYLGGTNNKKTTSSHDHQLPGTDFFAKSSAIFGYLYSGNKIDNFTKPGSVETLLLYAFYLQVADCTVSSYLYFSMTLKTCLILGWHCDAELGKINKFELEHHRRLFWTIYIYETMLSSKAGHPLAFQDSSISCQLPSDFDMTNPPEGCENYIFPEAEYLLACINTTVINSKILNKLYNRRLKRDISPTVTSLIRELLEFRHNLPDFLQVDFEKKPFTITRLKCNIYTEYFNGINLAVRRLVYHFSHMFLKKWLNTGKQRPEFISLDEYSENTIFLLNGSLTSSINTIQSLWSMFEQGQLAIFGYMDREYVFTAASTLVLMNATFGLHEQVNEFLDKALTILSTMRKQGNNPASLRKKQLVRLMKDLNLRDQMSHLINKFEDDWSATTSSYNLLISDSNEYVGSNDLVRTSTNSTVFKDVSANTILLKQNSFKRTDSEILGTTPLEKSAFPLHFLFQTPAPDGLNAQIDHKYIFSQSSNDFASTDIESVIKENANKLLSTGKEFEDLDKIFEVLDNNLDDDQLWKDVQEEAVWLA